MSETTPELILMIHMSETTRTYDNDLHGTFHASVHAAKSTARYESDPTEHLYDYQSPWARFALRAYYGDMKLCEGRSYGFEAGFQPEYSLVTSQEIERFHKGLKKIERACEKFDSAEGRAQSLGQEVIRIMRAIGIKHACWKRPAGQPGYSEYRDWQVVHTMEEVRYHIDSTIEACRQQQLDDQVA